MRAHPRCSIAFPLVALSGAYAAPMLPGTVFLFGRTSSMAARPNYSPTKPEFDREQFGVNLGGPLVKDKLFMFGNYEETNEDSAISVASPYYPNLTSYPAPYDERSSTARLDWRLPKATDFFFRWSRNENANLNGDGINGDLLPGTGRGSLGRDVASAGDLNTLIRAYNTKTAGTTLPRGGRATFLLEHPISVLLGDSFLSQDLQVTKVFTFAERYRIEASLQIFNLFNVSNKVGSGGLPGSAYNGTLTVVNSDSSGKPTGGFSLGSDGSLLNASGARALAGVDQASGFGSLGAIRPSIPTGTGLPRAVQLGIRFSF